MRRLIFILGAAVALAAPMAPAASAGTAAQGDLYAWKRPGGAPDKVFSGFDCQNADYRYHHWRVVDPQGAHVVWVVFNEPDCEGQGRVLPRETDVANSRVGSVQRFN
ncbi:hypothetical protein OHR68_31915 [Spirillospora sp. NBC_00431]